MDMGALVGKLFSPIFGFFFGFLKIALGLVVVLILAFLITFFVQYQFNPLKLCAEKLRVPFIRWKWFDLFRWLLVDFLERELHINEFKESGFTFYVGIQGAGKTISMVRYLERMKERYPKCLIVTNFGYYRANYIMKDWRDIITIRNGTDGVIFAIDEIHSEYSASSWKDVPEDILSEVSQQRKQRVKIVATAQFFSRVAKPLREQAVTVVSCTTLWGRLTCNKEYSALQYASVVDNPVIVKKRVKPLSKSSFVQSDALRACYDTYEKIKRMRHVNFIPRGEREAT